MRFTADDAPSITSPRHYVEGYVARDPRLAAFPARVLMLYDRVLFDRALARPGAVAVEFGFSNPHRIALFEAAPGRPAHAVVRGHHGAPMAAVQIEELAALGMRELIAAGPAGSLCDGTGPRPGRGDLVLAGRALSLDGTTRFYQAAPEAAADPGLTDRLERAAGRPLPRLACVTTDALYRETPALVRWCRTRGARIIDMELAAVFAVARHLGLRAAALLYVSDVVSSAEGWQLGFDEDRRRRAVAAMEEILERAAGAPA